MWVGRELSYALNQRRYQSKIIPVLVRDCDFETLHWALASFQMLTLASGFAAASRELLRIWGIRPTE